MFIIINKGFGNMIYRNQGDEGVTCELAVTIKQCKTRCYCNTNI